VRAGGGEPAAAGLPAGLTVRPFRLGDLPEIMRLEKEAFGRHAFDAATFLYYATVERQGFLVCELEGEFCGYVVARRSDLRRTLGEIPSIAISPALRRQGIGRLLLEWALAHLVGRGVEVVRLQVAVENTAAIALYESAGFSRRRRLEDYYGRDEDAVEMEKQLAER